MKSAGVLLSSCLALVLVLAGCSAYSKFVEIGTSAKYVSFGNTYPPKPEECPIEIFAAKLPDRPYEELGVVEGKETVMLLGSGDVLPEMIQEACQAGGDALIMIGDEEITTKTENGSTTTRYVSATLIRWSGEVE